MEYSGIHRLFDQEALHEAMGDGTLPGWALDHCRAFHDAMSGSRNGTEFPCYFGVESEARGMALYTFCESMTDEEALLALRDVLLEYVAVFEAHSDRASLVTFFKPPSRTLTEAEYNDRLWGILQFLHETDPEPWPATIPTDPDDPYWEFCFGGEPIFPTARAPFYEDRLSRYNPHGLEITFQPRTIFEGITGDTSAGQQARTVIRGRLETYDDAPPHDDLGDWGNPDDREWVQYMLPESTDRTDGECPFEFAGEVTE